MIYRGWGILTLITPIAPRQKGEVAPHHFFFVPMQWAALVIVAVCVVVALLR
ncbi:hypothetical protein I5V32_14525 [Stenotrophomonas maltophilia]|nr:hypothetical protein [Stenotrophomonas sp. GD04032]MBH1717341.1 hypothetical protein [Stenotrophomonas maltophilia]MDG9973753.1 hypothetical protein [Stenotrophomonas sp. GD04032]